MKRKISMVLIILSLLLVVTVTASPGPITTHIWDLNPGWNLVSTPVTPIDPKASTILADVGFYQLIEWTGWGYANANRFEVGVGYWILVLEPVSVDVIGEAVSQVNVSLTTGWTMIGGSNVEILQPEEITYLITWNGTAYEFADTITPGRGYWATADSEIEIPLG